MDSRSWRSSRAGALVATTTFDAIREIMMTQIALITPISRKGTPFRKFRSEGDFEEWAEKQGEAANRIFEIRNTFDFGDIQMHDLNGVMRPVIAEVMVAYRNDFRWGKEPTRDLDKIMDEDRIKIDEVIGLSAQAFSPNSSVRNPEFSIVEGEKVTFLVLEYDVLYHREVSP